jgi:putative DNA methylase
MSSAVTPFSLKNAPALIERLLPVQKLSTEAYKEQMAGSGKTLTALGSYWKGRKPLILNKACILGCLLPATNNPARDLEIFEMLMGMDVGSLEKRLEEKNTKESRFILSQHTSIGHKSPYREWVEQSCRPEECGDELYSHVWEHVNDYLGTSATTVPELVEQLGVMRYGHRPRVADTFCGSGQIPFEAARLGCDVFASDLNPVACMLTWAAMNIVGGSEHSRQLLKTETLSVVRRVQHEMERLNVESDGTGWKAKAFLYCVEVRCPQSGWLVPLIPSLVITRPRKGESGFVVAQLIPDKVGKRYDIVIKTEATSDEVREADAGTVRSDGRGQEPYMIHTVNGTEFKTKISTLRGDYQSDDGRTLNRLRQWEKTDFKPQESDIFQERLYAVQWMRQKPGKKTFEYEFRSVTIDDMKRERTVEEFIESNIVNWQAKGWVPDMMIEQGSETTRLSRERGWNYWHQLFTPRQILLAGLLRMNISSLTAPGLAQVLNWNSKLSHWNPGSGGGGSVAQTFYNQALNTFFNHGCRASGNALSLIEQEAFSFPICDAAYIRIHSQEASKFDGSADFFVTDPPYGDAVNYDEILDFFIAWFRKAPPKEFSRWTWDSRRSLAIKGSDEDFRRGMVASFKRMTECLPENGLQVIMFTHQSESIWADMANIVWASGLQVTAAWYVVTETDSALRDGSNVKGTVLLVCRKRHGTHKTTRDDLAWEIQEEVESQVLALTGLNQEAKGQDRDENVFEDADIQMAGYAAALRVLTRYALIDGRDMTAEAIRPRVKGETTFVDGLIAFAVDTANQCLVPQDLSKSHWDKLSGVERFYLKLLDMEARGAKTLDNYQNFAKAFKVRDFQVFLASRKANAARLKSAVELGRTEMSEGSELHQSVLRAVLYAIMELVKEVDSAEVLAHLMLNIPDYYGNMTQRDLAVELADYLAKNLEQLRPEEAASARVLRELVKNQRLG